MARGLCVGAIVTVMAGFFVDFTIHSFALTVGMILMTAILFSLGGFINAVFADKFDDISIIPAFVLTPLTYLGGVFYSLDLTGLLAHGFLLQPHRVHGLELPLWHLWGERRRAGLSFRGGHRGFVVLFWTISPVLLNRGTGIRA